MPTHRMKESFSPKNELEKTLETCDFLEKFGQEVVGCWIDRKEHAELMLSKANDLLSTIHEEKEKMIQTGDTEAFTKAVNAKATTIMLSMGIDPNKPIDFGGFKI